jgi:osmotically-inducible protein OsmY
MNKLTIPLLSTFLLLGAVACDASRTSQQAPPSTENSGQVANQEEASEAKEDATSDIRRNQLNSDIRAREQRNNAFNSGQAQNRDDDNLASEVRSKLEANLPASALAVEAKNGVVTVSGTVPTQEQYNRIGNLAQEIKGVQAVNVKAKVAPAQPNTQS